MRDIKNILIIHTAFLGDIILVTPLIRELKEFFPFSGIDILTTPSAGTLLENNPSLRSVLTYDKKGAEKGTKALLTIAKKLRREKYDIVICPHRSLRSAILGTATGAMIRVAFNRSAGSFLFTHLVKYQQESHEISRNLSLLGGLGIHEYSFRLPELYPGENHRVEVSRLLAEYKIDPTKEAIIAIAPGSVWYTKRWLPERYSLLGRNLAASGYSVILVGGREDIEICEGIVSESQGEKVYSAAGKLSLLASAHLLSLSRLLVTNDSAPLHMGNAMGIPVVAIFGATVPDFGFGPKGENDVVIQTRGLACRPCAIHGGQKCPITTFDCMKNISVEKVEFAIAQTLRK